MPNKAAFSDRSWQERETVLGDPAEQAFIQWATASNMRHVKYGLDRPPISLAHIPSFIRYTPDFLTDDGLVEVQGCGRDQTFKFKHDKLWAVSSWDDWLHASWYLWNQQIDMGVMIGHSSLLGLCYDEPFSFRRDGIFDGSKPYAAVTWDMLTKVT